ncbi:MAG: alpha/beta fold hydrolase [Myxococcota bacterium]
MPTLNRDGITLHYLDEGKGPPLLLLHAFPLSVDSFWPQLQSLTVNYRLIVPDQRGFGKSGVGEGASQMSMLAEDASAILDACGISSAVVCGVSMGGYVAMALLRLDPGRVRALVLIDTQAGADDEAGKAKREETARAVEQQGTQVLVESLLPRLLSPRAKPEVKDRLRRDILANSPRGVAAALRGMALRLDSRDILTRYGGPALVVIGEEDVITPPAKAEEMVKLIGGAKMARIPGAGHLSHLEAPEIFHRKLHAFLTQLQ